MMAEFSSKLKKVSIFSKELGINWQIDKKISRFSGDISK